MTGPVIRRGEVWWVSFTGAIGSEIRKTRPAIVVSNNRANEALDRLQVVPLSSRVDRVYPGECLVLFEGETRKALASQIATVDKARCGSRAGFVGDKGMQEVERAIAVQLGLTFAGRR